MYELKQRNRIKIPGKQGTYYVFDSETLNDGTDVYELEHEICRFDVEHLIVDADLNVLMETWSGLDEYLDSINEEQEDE
ncbi:MAG: hypothetical protein MJZ34_02270 [Paludibacteraceae bacterium]|nr:hypothetical protein [Paludibacteraceae bacterium]